MRCTPLLFLAPLILALVQLDHAVLAATTTKTATATAPVLDAIAMMVQSVLCFLIPFMGFCDRGALILNTSAGTCPNQPPQPSDSCFWVGAGGRCDYGEECCCGSCAPSYSCTCQANGQFQCMYGDHCLGSVPCNGTTSTTNDTCFSYYSCVQGECCFTGR